MMQHTRERIKGRKESASTAKTTPVKIQMMEAQSRQYDAPRCNLILFFFPASYFLLKSSHQGDAPDSSVAATIISCEEEEESAADSRSFPAATPPKTKKHDDDDCWTEEYNRMCQRRRVHSDKKMYFSETTTYRLRASPLHSPLIARKLHY